MSRDPRDLSDERNWYHGAIPEHSPVLGFNSGLLYEQQGNLRSAVYEVGGGMHYAVEDPQAGGDTLGLVCGGCGQPWVCKPLWWQWDMADALGIRPSARVKYVMEHGWPEYMIRIGSAHDKVQEILDARWREKYPDA